MLNAGLKSSIKSIFMNHMLIDIVTTNLTILLLKLRESLRLFIIILQVKCLIRGKKIEK